MGIWLDRATVAKLRAMRRPGDSFSHVILALAKNERVWKPLYWGDLGASDRYTGGGWAVPGPVSGIFGRALNPVTVTLSEGRQTLTRTCPK